MNKTIKKINDSALFWRTIAIVLIITFLTNSLFEFKIASRFWKKEKSNPALSGATEKEKSVESYAANVIPETGVVIPVKWGNYGEKLVENGAIDQQAFAALYARRGGLNENERALLTGAGNENIVIDINNAQYWLNLLWAFGLANKNPVLDQGPMQDPQYGGAGNFASTGGWTLAQGNPMDHYSQHEMIKLNPEQQALVEKVAKGIYRPCCGNSVHFPDCNHGLAMLGLLELLAAEGVQEKEMFEIALRVNSYWFPETYLTIAKYLDQNGVDWNDANPAALLGYEFSSSAGYQNILAQTEPVQSAGGGSCGV